MIKQFFKIIICLGVLSVGNSEAIGFGQIIPDGVKSVFSACAKKIGGRLIQGSPIEKLVLVGQFFYSLGLVKGSVLVACVVYLVCCLVSFLKDVAKSLLAFMSSPFGNTFKALRMVIGFVIKSLLSIVAMVVTQVGARMFSRAIDSALIQGASYLCPMLMPAKQ